MKRVLGFCVAVILFWSCDQKSKIEKEVEAIPVNMKLVRFEQAFFETNPNDLAKVKATYPKFFPSDIPDSVWVNKLKNKDWQALYQEVEAKYKDFSSEQTEIEDIFKHVKYYFPKVKEPTIYTCIGSMDHMAKAIYINNELVIALEMYLGKNHKFYTGIDKYIRENFEPRQMMPDVVAAIGFTVIPRSKHDDFISQMIDAGKEMYLKDLLIPSYTDAEKMGYTPEQLKFCQENEGYVWENFIVNKYLYSTDSKLANRFVNMAPFSKFYLEIDNETPGRIGQWVGWQIIRSFVENNEKVTPKELLAMDAHRIFEGSKYKPKKNE
ncbi:gliding motility lipoprotein GldB [Flavobacterium stagni]|uniref:Gliding motility lipoprotein GldB n=1 Tax=Flavobacterium stagni TaxID=2506421 RepID=A0A4Q1KAK4_9FLAO|nr:gliding motility lipoprotein GldB [Flavobacterium stagni]RXR23942.1 gliding motility lipoprotein GldB [Flavobacterium stagni]